MRTFFLTLLIVGTSAFASAASPVPVANKTSAVLPKGDATTLLSCVSSGAEGSMVKTLVLEKNAGPGFTARMESAFEDGVVEIAIPSSVQTAASTQYVIKHDHDLLMTLATFQKQAVVFYQSTDGSDQSVNVEFLLCK